MTSLRSISKQVDPFEYEGVIYKTIGHALYGARITDGKALILFLNSPLDPKKSFDIIREDLRSNQEVCLRDVLRARFLRNEESKKKLLRIKTSDPIICDLKLEIDRNSFIQQELFDE